MARLEKILFYLLLLTLPFQTRIILTSFSIPFNEWQTVFFYGTDILIGAIFILALARHLAILKSRKKTLASLARLLRNGKMSLVFLGLFLLIGLFSLTQAVNPRLGFYQLGRLGAGVFLFLYIRSNLKYLSLKRILQILAGSGLFQALVAIGQFIKQSDLGLRFLGESLLGPNIAGVAKLDLWGEKVIRAYGTFPHPNILGSFLTVAVFSLYVLYLSEWPKPKAFKSRQGLGLLALACGLMLSGLFLTFSRVVLGVWALIMLTFFIIAWQRHQKFKINLVKLKCLIFLLVACLLLLVALFWPLVLSRFLIQPQEQAVQLRLFYAQSAFSLIKEHPFLGVGLGNFVASLKLKFPSLVPWAYQPVHNVFLLILAEIGILGLFSFLFFLVFLLRETRLNSNNLAQTSFWLLLIGFLFIMVLDHFFWSLQSGRLILWLVLGILAGLPFTRSTKLC